MIKNFEMRLYISGRHREPFKLTSRRLTTSEEALAIARKCLQEEPDGATSVLFRYTEDDLDFEVGTNSKGLIESINIAGLMGTPETVLASLPGRPLSDLIQGSPFIEEVIGDRVIVECSYNPQIKRLIVIVEGSGKGWWFMR